MHVSDSFYVIIRLFLSGRLRKFVLNRVATSLK